MTNSWELTKITDSSVIIKLPPIFLLIVVHSGEIIYILTTNGSYKVPYRTQRFHVERKGSVSSHFQEKVLQRDRLGSGFQNDTLYKLLVCSAHIDVKT